MIKRILFLVLLAQGLSYGQLPGQTISIDLAPKEKPLVIFNNNTLAGLSILIGIRKEEFRDLEILKDVVLSDQNLFPLDPDSSGIIKANVTTELEVKTQTELNDFFGLETDNDIYINGFLLKDKSMRIAARSINQIELRKADGLILTSPALNITLQ